MKKIILLLSLLVSSAGSSWAQDDYYYYKGQKIPLTENAKKKFVLLEEEQSNGKGKAALRKSGASIQESEKDEISGTLIPYKGKKLKENEHAIIEFQSKSDSLPDSLIVYEASFYKPQNGEEAPLSNLFYVKLKDTSDIGILEEMAAKYKVEILGNNIYMRQWYTLSASNNSKGNALQIANKFFESGKFIAAEPEFLFPFKTNCKNDNLFQSQWNLNNTGQNGGSSGIDIKACQAWSVTQGASDIIVAVLDEGVQLNHPDMPNIYPLSFNAHTGTSPSIITGTHGTRCAGIIGASSNNSIGLAGIAPNCPIMSINIDFALSSPAKFADGINFAWNNGASVISNSWYYTGWETYMIDDAIELALTQGRGGLGTVVVFSSGNGNGVVDNPADNNPNTIVVGALSPCGERKSYVSCDGETWWGSSYGPELDVMAPGVFIPTTDVNSGYYSIFNGTSSAAPHVAGIAALILSVNPTLTRKQVTDIIEASAQKVGGYNYSTTSGRTNGSWNNEMGYGLINAKTAVDLANPSSSSGLLAKYNVPRSTAIPGGFKQYSRVHVLGNGGPNLSNVFNSVFNWQGSSSQPNALYQFTLETNNGIPRSYTNIPSYGSYMLHASSPEITINSSIGFPGMAGSYWVNLDGNNLVLVEKSGNFALYFSNSNTPPSARKADVASETSDLNSMEIIASPNPFTQEATVVIPEGMGICNINIMNLQGQVIETLVSMGSVVLGSNYLPGIYNVKIVGSSEVRQVSILKQ